MSATEQWLPIPGWPMYEVSTLGRVASYYGANRTRRLLRCAPSTSTGYPVVDLREGERRRLVAVHVVVAETFIGPRPMGQEVRHLDGDRLNAALSNLTYGTHAENELDKLRHGTHQNGSRTHCIRNHPFDDHNTYRQPGQDRRTCKECRKDISRRYRIRRAFRAAGIEVAA